MNTTRMTSGWANYPMVEAAWYEAADRKMLRNYVLENEQFIVRGNGKSYGDASLAPNILSTLALNRILGFDPEKGIISCESGALLSDLLKVMVPAGWFFQVTPGIKDITVGGAIASDVHGKNHPVAGCFSSHLISFELMNADGEIVICSKSENKDLFWQTCGGMGWTGVILSATFKLLKISSPYMRQNAVKAQNLAGIFKAFEDHSDWPYAAGWVDCTDPNWRGVVLLAKHQEAADSQQPLVFLEAPKRNVPFFAPAWFLNPWSIKAHNYFYFNKKRGDNELVTLDKYFYPLDALQHWNRFYGRRGFVQYQFCLPQANAYAGMQLVLKGIAESGETPFLTVLKRHGERPPEAIHSFPERGYSLALDFPRTRGIFNLVKKLDEIVWAHEGKIYLTKDACSAPKMGRVDAASFGDAKFSSLLRRRISPGTE